MISRSKPTARVGCKIWRQERLARLCLDAKLADEARGLPGRGASKRMADRLGIAPTALSNMLHGAKNIGDEAARSIESILGLETGGLDVPLFCAIGADEGELAAMVLALAAHRLAQDHAQ